MFDIILFIVFWLIVWLFISYGFYYLTSAHEGLLLLSLFISLIITFTTCMATSRVVTVEWARNSPILLENVTSISDLQVQSLTLPNGGVIEVFVLSDGWERRSSDYRKTRRVRLVSDVVVSKVTEGTPFYEIKTKSRISGIFWISPDMIITTTLPEGYENN